jgi:hypothetical protein
MRMSRMSWTTRRLTILVALTALALHGVQIISRLVYYARRARYHADHLESARSILGETDALRQWHKDMKRKYEHAFEHPWSAVVPPDPEPPDRKGKKGT